MMTFAQFLDEQEKRLILFGVAAAKKDGGMKKSGGDHHSLNIMPNFKVVNPTKIFNGIPVPGEIYGKKKRPSGVLGRR